MNEGVWTLIKTAYRLILRPLVLKAIDNPDSEIDDFAMRLLDNLFEYNSDGK